MLPGFRLGIKSHSAAPGSCGFKQVFVWRPALILELKIHLHFYPSSAFFKMSLTETHTTIHSKC